MTRLRRQPQRTGGCRWFSPMSENPPPLMNTRRRAVTVRRCDGGTEKKGRQRDRQDREFRRRMRAGHPGYGGVTAQRRWWIWMAERHPPPFVSLEPLMMKTTVMSISDEDDDYDTC
ncbi:hypothetical protein Hdeb2414_s0004g00135611 [Helianthus debilis subsp. tardiflorus]